MRRLLSALAPAALLTVSHAIAAPRGRRTITYNKTGIEHPFRGIWTPQEDGSVKQEFYEQDPDTTKWSIWFTGIYRRA